MSHLVEPAVAEWVPPTWTTSEFVDTGCVERRMCLGEIAPEESDDRLVVEVVQRDVLEATDPISTTRVALHVSVAGIWLCADEARELARVLLAAADVVDGSAPTDGPHLGRDV